MKMLTIRFVVGCFFLCSAPCALAGIKYRQATEGDVNGIVALCNHFSEDDKSKLLVFPQDKQKAEIFKHIRKGRFFVAYDKASKQIISFLKLCVVDSEDVGGILTQELCLGLESPLVKDDCYCFSDELLHDFRLPLKQIDFSDRCFEGLLDSDDKDLIRSNKLDSCLYLYHGSAYTHPIYRGHGIYTDLLVYAFDKVQDRFFGKKHIALLYGQVNANVRNVAIIRVFAKCIAEVFSPYLPGAPFFPFYEVRCSNNIRLQHLCCRAYKPEFNVRGEIEVIRDENHAGLGSMLVYSV